MAWKKGDELHDQRYTIERQLGKGNCDITYLANTRQGKRLVIKTVSDELLKQLGKRSRERLQEKFLQESVKLARYKHPHIVRVKEPFLEGEQVYIAMEYITGVDLASHTQNKLSQKEALRYIQQIGEALKVVHADNLVHRNVKPRNIMLRGGKQDAVLINFGLVRGFNNPLTTINADTADGFDSLELYQVDAKLEACTDIYSLAATLYFLLTGKEPPSAMERSLGNAQLQPPKEINSEVSDRVNQAILEGMALAVEDRPQEMQQWLDLLGLKPEMAKPWRNWNMMTWLAIFSTVAGFLGAIGIWIALKPSSSPSPNPQSQSQLIK